MCYGDYFSVLSHAVEMELNCVPHGLLNLILVLTGCDTSGKIRRKRGISRFSFFHNDKILVHFKLACLRMLLSVPGARSSPGWPAPVSLLPEPFHQPFQVGGQVLAILLYGDVVIGDGRTFIQALPRQLKHLRIKQTIKIPKAMLRVDTSRFGYPPQGGWHTFIRSCCVRHVFPLRATYFRQVLPHVRGFPTLRVLCSIRLPPDQGPSASALVPLPALWPLRFGCNLSPGFLPSCLSVSRSILPRRSRMGLPSSCVRLFVHATA